MGMYDSVYVAQRCPYCGTFQTFEAQTKDLDSLLWRFEALSENWFREPSKSWRKMRQKLPVFPSFPKDKSHKVWKSQAEEIEASAAVSDRHKKLKYVDVVATCSSDKCRKFAAKRGIMQGSCRLFEGKVKIRNGFLVEPIYDIVLPDSKLSRKTKKRKAK